MQNKNLCWKLPPPDATFWSNAYRRFLESRVVGHFFKEKTEFAFSLKSFFMKKVYYVWLEGEWQKISEDAVQEIDSSIKLSLTPFNKLWIVADTRMLPPEGSICTIDGYGHRAECKVLTYYEENGETYITFRYLKDVDTLEPKIYSRKVDAVNILPIDKKWEEFVAKAKEIGVDLDNEHINFKLRAKVKALYNAGLIK